MSHHPYPQHIVDDVADYLKPYTSSRIEAGSLAHQVLNRIWKASRVDTMEQLEQLPGDSVLTSPDHRIKSAHTIRFLPRDNDLPAHVIYWGDASE